MLTNNRFCGQDEEHDPCEEFEDYMACAVCGDNCKFPCLAWRSLTFGNAWKETNRGTAHRQCARDNNSLTTNDDSNQWRCPDCVNNALEPDTSAVPASRRRSSASKFTRDLLPAPRGGSRPGSHSVFNTLILDDDPLDGSRSLRKRKASSAEVEILSKSSGKRRKKRSSKDEFDSDISRSPSLAEDEAEEDERQAEPVQVTAGQDGSNVEAIETLPTRVRPSRPTRPRRPKKAHPPKALARIIERSNTTLIIAIQIDPTRLRELQPKKKRRRPPPTISSSGHRPRFMTSHYATPFYSFHEKENDELKSKPYGGILLEEEADTSKTMPLHPDRKRFDEGKHKAEEEWKIKTVNAEAEQESRGRASQKVSGPPSKIKCINFGGYEIETWYAAPYPEEYSRNRILYICEFCLKYMNSDYVAWRHKLKCPAKHPPGDEIYRDKSVSVFEVDGRKNPVYCQNLCLLAKLFLGSKTLYYDVEPFLFYIMTESDEFGCHFVGYFSKEKRPSSMNNVSCILTLPIHQRKGYGNLLIDFSYLLTRVERKTGSPEKPLSDMGLVSYRNYWRLVLSYQLLDQKQSLSVTDISDRTGMTADDIVAALEALRALVRDPITKTYALRLDSVYFKQCIEAWEEKKYVKLNADALTWTPYIMGRANLAHYDRAPPLATIAPREGEEEEISPEEGVEQQIKEASDAGARADGTVIDKAPDTSDILNETYTARPASKLITYPLPPTPALTQISLEKHTTNGILAPSQPSPPLAASTIPPTRYEVFPPVPGTISRRRGGWRGGTRKSTVGTPATSTSLRRGGKNLGVTRDDGNGSKTPKTSGKENGKGKSLKSNSKGDGDTPSGRKTRSTVVDDGEQVEDEEEEEEDDDEDDEGDDEEDDDEREGDDEEDARKKFQLAAMFTNGLLAGVVDAGSLHGGEGEAEEEDAMEE